MSLTLAQFRTRVLDLLDDLTSARYTSAQIDTALRDALIDYSVMRPVKRTYMLDTTGAAVIALPADFAAMQITRLQLWNNDPNLYLDLDFFTRLVDEQWSIEAKERIYPTGKVLIVTYTTRQTIDSLDSASGTTIDDDNLLCLGAAGYAAQSRAVSRSETINMQPQVQKQLMDLSTRYFSQFYNRLPLRNDPSFAAFTDPSIFK